MMAAAGHSGHRLLRGVAPDAAAGRGPWCQVLAAIDGCGGWRPGAEVTTEANPDSVDLSYLAHVCAGAASPGSASACRVPSPGCWPPSTAAMAPAGPRPRRREARGAGFEQVSLDLIYGTPGESDAEWRDSLAARRRWCRSCVGIRAHGRVGTAMGAAVARGVMPAPGS